ncbi:MAG: hypothetical protein DMD96_04505 [Candidatus Rokuibacteriota bacterium]|nr:MAG: hypothetical protein DMD96_04505 [Candidatus Rokubacteria bacterium]
MPFLQGSEEHRQVATAGDRRGEVRELTIEPPHLGEDVSPPLIQRVAVRTQPVDRQLDRPLHDLWTQEIVLDGGEHGVIRRVHRQPAPGLPRAALLQADPAVTRSG